MTKLLESLNNETTIIDLAQQYTVGMPQSPNHPQFWHTYPRRHGDMSRSDGGSAANDMITTGTHVGTHIDALAHVSQDGKLFGGADAVESCIGGKYASHGVHTIPPYFGRGILLDIAKLHGVNCLDGGYEITLEDIQSSLSQTETTIRPGDVVLIRSGWGGTFTDYSTYMGSASGVPGIGAEAGAWLAEQQPFAVGADSTAFEVIRPGAGHATLPVHRIMLVENGIYIIETLNLEALSKHGATEFGLTFTPLNIFGATGSPIRPLALIQSAIPAPQEG